MPLDIGAVQKALEADGLDAWLLYDFHGSNPVSYRLAGMGGAGHLATRRWFYLIPQSGEPQALVHAIERYNLDHLPGIQDGLRRPRAAAGGPDAAARRA